MSEFIKLFPDYEDVFYDDLENHKKYFLPICSFNLQLLEPSKNEWLHIVSVKEIYDGCVGEESEEYHTQFTKSDMLGFDIIDGKYKFDSDWNYFQAFNEITPEQYGEDFSDLDIEYNMNEAMYQLKKAYYNKHGKLYDKYSYRPGLIVDDIRRLERLRQLTVEDLEKDEDSDYMVERAEKKLYGIFEELNIEKKSLEDSNFGGENLMNKPTLNEELLDYIACIEGYDFQQNAADQIFLFHDDSIKKAVICFEYT
ncbi:hypothetical protein [Chryseobacterium jejuense]|uniref:Uncharacterized protein n=1 Tax=Chryseobacterium jejuense TaxID=445960 RepID=A0A2X2X3D4_CHRJE|nr:hypothetical protein [Chryseobacterium jejuense]SDI29697.1 hypothetical protein SAMN05421542_0752 [Chryseobacterium jejuense]SQB44663.1 Uncharacterised protein [Chryseobacterium jejuense]